MTTGADVLPDSEPTASIALTTSKPFVTLPKTTCLPSSLQAAQVPRDVARMASKADQEGVVQLSGWSPSMLTALQKGGVQVMTPYQGMRIVLDDKRYDEVRNLWNELHECHEP